MNTEKAIDLLDNLIGMIEDNQENDYDTAFHMAINALKAQSDSDTISRQAAVEACYNGWNKDYRGIAQDIKDLPPAQPEKRTEERTETHACDCIERQAVIDALRTCYDTETVTMDDGDEYINYGDAIGEIEQLPSAQPTGTPLHDSGTDYAHGFADGYKQGLKDAQPEIVQCEDCRHWEQETFNDGYCTEMDLRMCDADFYCGYAERRTDEADYRKE